MRAHVIGQIVLALAIGHAVAVVGQVPRDPGAPRDGSTPRENVIPPFIARGRVVAADGTPLRRVRVSVQGGQRSEPTFSNDDGRFELIVPSSAGGGLRFTKPGFVPASISRQTAQASGDPAVTLIKGAAINGTVLDQTGAAAVGVVVRVRRIDAAASGGGQLAIDTDDLGAFRVGNLPAGRYAIVAGTPGGGRARGATPDGTTGVGGAQRGRGRGGRGGRGDQQLLSPDTPTVDLAAGQEASVLVFHDAPTPAVPSGAAPPQTASRDTQTATGSIRGRVLSHDAAPISGASVQVSPAEGGGTRRSAVTDAAGRYEITGLAQGRYRARVTKSGLVSVEYGQSRALQSGRVIDLGRNERLQGIDVTMPKGSAVTGTIVDASGEPVEGVDVQAWQARFTDGRTALAPAAGASTRRTDDRGQYRLYGLLPGTYYVVASENNTGGGRGGRGGRGGPGAADSADTAADLRVFYPGTPFLTSANTIQADVGQDTAGVDITLVRGRAARVQGVARRASGQPARGRAVISVSHRSGAPALPLQTAALDADGAFEFQHVSPGDIRRPSGGRRFRWWGSRIAARGGGPAIDGRGGAAGGTTGRAGAGDVGGARSAAGQGAPGQQPVGAGPSRGRGGGQQASAGTQGSRGGGAPGRGAGGLLPRGQATDREFGAQFVTVLEGEVASVVIDTFPGVRMTGRIVMEGDASNVQPSSFGLSAYPADPDMSPLQGVRALRATIEDDGTFEIADLIGRFVLLRRLCPTGWWLKSVNVNGVNAVEDPAVFGKGALSGTDVLAVFADGAGAVEGRVLNERRQPATEFKVLVFAASADRWFSQSPYVKFGSASQDGTFTVTGVPPGQYLVAAVDHIDGGTDYGDWQNPAVLNALAASARRLSVGTGQRVTTELRLVSLSR